MSLFIRQSAGAVLILLLASIAFTSCKKQKPQNGTGPGPANSCPLIREYYSQPDGTAQTWSIIPDHDNHLREVVGQDSYGNTSLNGTIGGSGLNLQYNGIIAAYNFNDNIFTGKPTQYIYSTSNGLKSSQTLSYDKDGNIFRINAFDANDQPSSTVDMEYTKGNLMRVIYQSQNGPRTLSTYQAIGYDDHPNPYADMAGARYLFYNWDYFNATDDQMGILYQHCSKNNCLGYYIEFNGVKYIDETFAYTYDDRGYPTSVDQHYIFRSSETGVTISDNHYVVNYTYNNCD